MFEVGAGVTELNVEIPEFAGGALAAALGVSLKRRALTVWQEHCSECAMPGCYSSCSFYTPRSDFKCRRFPGGVSLLPATPFTAAPMRLRFGKWARLLGYGPTSLHPLPDANRKEAHEVRMAKRADSLVSLQGLAAPFLRRRVNRLSATKPWGASDVGALYLVIEVFNQSSNDVSLSLSCRVLGDETGAAGQPFEVKLLFAPGYGVKAVPVSAFVAPSDVGRRFSMQVAPSNYDDHPEVAFGLLDIVELSDAPREAVRSESAPPITAKSPKVKCVIWDLDNTLWSGTLVEDDLRGVRLRPDAVRAIHALDQKGILQSVASKNDPDVAVAALHHFGLADYFLFPQISWEPKSLAIGAIARHLNISSDTFAFVDDQEFERAEVLSQHPEVLAVDSSELEYLLAHDRLRVEVTTEAAMRRQLYKDEEQRAAALASSAGAYEEFLRSCEMQVEIAPLAEADAVRAHELAQRTNQLNIWPSRYTLDEVRRLTLGGHGLRAYTVRATDRFGSYGLVGFCVLDDRTRTIRDLMFSCRIQGKLVGEAFTAWLAAQFPQPDQPLQARYKQTPKNGPAKALLEASGFRAAEPDGDGERWVQTSSYRTLEEIGRIVRVSAPTVGSHVRRSGADNGGPV